MIRRYSILAILILCLGSIAAQDPKTAPKLETPKAEESIYPIAIGSKWTYIIIGQGRECTVTAARMEKVGNQDCVVLEATLSGATPAELMGTEHIALVNGEYLRLKNNKSSVDPPLIFLKANIKKNDTWKSNFEAKMVGKDGKEEKSKAEAEYAVEEDKIKVEAGEYQTLLVRGKIKEVGQETKTAVWYAKGIGPVKIEFDYGAGGKVVLELKSAEIKK